MPTHSRRPHLWLVIDGQDDLCDASCFECLHRHTAPPPLSAAEQRACPARPPPLVAAAAGATAADGSSLTPRSRPPPHLNLMTYHGSVAKVDKRLGHRQRQGTQARSCGGVRGQADARSDCAGLCGVTRPCARCAAPSTLTIASHKNHGFHGGCRLGCRAPGPSTNWSASAPACRT
jgi:hypothetical protein